MAWRFVDIAASQGIFIIVKLFLKNGDAEDVDTNFRRQSLRHLPSNSRLSGSKNERRGWLGSGYL